MSNASFWDKIAAKYARDPISDMAAYAETRDHIRNLLQPHHRILEIGCGTGSTALELADKVDRYIGTDVSPKMIDIAKSKKKAGARSHLSFAVQEANDLPPGPHDAILALNLLHLLPDLEEILARVYAALPSGGLFIAKTALMKDGAWFLPWAVPVMRMLGKAPYVRWLNQAELLEALEREGFSVKERLSQSGIAPRLFTVAHKP